MVAETFASVCSAGARAKVPSSLFIRRMVIHPSARRPASVPCVVSRSPPDSACAGMSASAGKPGMRRERGAGTQRDGE